MPVQNGTAFGRTSIGFAPECQYEATVLLPAGTIVVLRADGVDEVMNAAQEQFGEYRLRDCVLAAPHEPASVCKHLFAAVQAYASSEPQKEDITLLAFGRDCGSF